jgi:NADH-quinone oxidoreductase subunit L
MNLLFLTILFPLLGFLSLAFSQGRWSENRAAIVGVGSIGVAALVTVIAAIGFYSAQGSASASYIYSQTIWQWMSVADFNISATLLLDGLSLTMLSVVIGVGFFIHLFASWYMRGEEGYSRFFAYTNLFIASMVVLVLADNLLLMYLGWEGVGLCSYLLIGFYYKNPNNGAAAMKAFIVTRIGDVFMAIGLFILFAEFGTLNIQELNSLVGDIARDPQLLAQHASAINWAALMLVGGAFGKSAQLPLQTWLADAMAGPTPVSALIHAATMVTAGVYLIARTHGLFLAAPDVLYLVGIVGAITLLLAGCAALVQIDIKRVLAYSTMSQLGYMFLALGVQAWDAAIFHLMTHAFFKALLFLASGSVIIACHHEQNIFKMGGLFKKIPLVYAAFLVGGSALSALPVITAGFYSKDEILWGALSSGHSGLMMAGLVGAFLTSIYTFRMIFIVFHGEAKTEAHSVGGISHSLPLIVLILLSTALGAFITLPFANALPSHHYSLEGKVTLEIISGLVATAGILIAAALYLGKRTIVNGIAASNTGRFLSNWWFNAWGFDWLYDKIFVKPYLRVASCLENDVIDKAVDYLPKAANLSNKGLAVSENGYLRWYVASICLGAVLVLAALLLV